MESCDSALVFELAKHILQRVAGDRLTFSGLKESRGKRYGVYVRLDVLKSSHSKGNGALLASFSGDNEVTFRKV